MRYWFPRSSALPLSLYSNIIKKSLASWEGGKRLRCSQAWRNPKLEENRPYASDPSLLSQKVFWARQKIGAHCIPPAFSKGAMPMWYSRQNNFYQPLHSKVNQVGAGPSLSRCFSPLSSLELLLICTDIYMRTESTNGILMNSSVTSISQTKRTQPYKRYKAIWRGRFETRRTTHLLNLIESGSRAKKC